ncbi:MAG TPA: hypothetical protein VMM93_01195 [Vicinamibacterales bacterium]|nr:hypothetical protein [Vicinamibacterales bacterium]
MTDGPPLARLIVARTHDADVGQRQVYVSLDGTSIATMVHGDVVEHDIAPGPHRLRFNNTLVWKTVHFDAGPGDRIEFVYANRPGRWTLGFLSLVGVAPLFLTIERRA